MTKADRPNEQRPAERASVRNARWPRWLAGLALAIGVVSFASSAALAETRTLKLYFIHTKERAEITFKRNGRYDAAGLKKVNNFLRDWRRNEPTKMDPHLLDAVWEAYQSVGARDYIHVVSAYRSPATNSMLRSRSKGVANKSQHMLGKAMDFYIPGVPLKKLRDAGLRAQAGGVGYYPRSGSPFVHFDVGNVRHWPRMSRQELVAVFPNGKTMHVPSDGKPLPGYEQAVASYESRRKSGATALALASSPARSGRSGGLLAALFGGGADEEEDNSETSVAAAAPARAPARETAREAARPPAGIQVVSPEDANPASVPFQEADETEQTPQTIIAALPARDVPLPLFAPRPDADVGGAALAAATDPTQPDSVPFGMASAEPEAAADAALAENIPLPTWRPEQEEVPATALLALAPPPPEARPDVEGMSLASLIDSTEGQLKAQAQENEQRLAMLSNAEEMDVASLSDASEPAPGTTVAAIESGAQMIENKAIANRTTAKSARAIAGAKPAPKPQVVAAQPEAARWAMGADAELAYAAEGPSIAHLTSVPNEVYATGFQRDTVVADASRFSGKAVSFMPVARFQN